MDRVNFSVDYRYRDPNGSAYTRQTIQGNTLANNMAGASSEFEVQAYLQRRHPDKVVEILNLRWL